MKLCHMTGHEVVMIAYVQIFGGPAPQKLPPKFGRAKKVENSVRFRTILTLTVNILGNDRDIRNPKQT